MFTRQHGSKTSMQWEPLALFVDKLAAGRAERAIFGLGEAGVGEESGTQIGDL
jgi:hypothetical protein